VIWDAAYPDSSRVRAEVEGMTRAYVDALLERVPREEIVGLYAKGSAVKPWDAPLDYVPELSDVDLHVLVRDPARLEAGIGGLRGALDLQARAEALFFELFPEPVHVPRPQLVLLNALKDQPFYVPSVASTVCVLFGEPYPTATALDAAGIRRLDVAALLEHEGYLARLPWSVVDTPAKFLWGRLRELSWRVSPTASRVLSALGVSYAEAWGGNRSSAVRQLEALGEHALAAAYAAFYASAWEFDDGGEVRQRRVRRHDQQHHALVLAGVGERGEVRVAEQREQGRERDRGDQQRQLQLDRVAGDAAGDHGDRGVDDPLHLFARGAGVRSERSPRGSNDARRAPQYRSPAPRRMSVARRKDCCDAREDGTCVRPAFARRSFVRAQRLACAARRGPARARRDRSMRVAVRTGPTASHR
jgi:hypothetical protein